MRYKVLFTPDAAGDFKALDGSVKKPVAKQLKRLEEAPHLGQPHGNRHGFDLTGYYKIYAVKKSIRIYFREVAE